MVPSLFLLRTFSPLFNVETNLLPLRKKSFPPIGLVFAGLVNTRRPERKRERRAVSGRF